MYIIIINTNSERYAHTHTEVNINYYLLCQKKECGISQFCTLLSREKLLVKLIIASIMFLIATYIISVLFVIIDLPIDNFSVFYVFVHKVGV